ncbi:MAG: SEL1-like repeat protein, partial [Proteobacteria bacterium]|nr:SEL1-like repeat protein [Pseudomonadota bacterium]
MKKLFLAVLLVTVPLSALAETESLTKYRALAKQGDANAEFNIGLIYYEGRSASEEGIWVEAIGESIRQGSRGSILDTEWLADKIWDKVVGKKSPDPIEQAEQAWAKMDSSKKRAAQRDSGLKALRDKIQRKNYKNAAKWFGLAAKHGDAEGQYYFGVLYNRGEGVKKNDATAVQWYKKAAEQGNLNAQSLLGDSYVFGVGVEENDQTAAEWYRLAAAQGDPVAQQLLECLEPIVADSSSGAFLHSNQMKGHGGPLTGCTWDRKNFGGSPIFTSYLNGNIHGIRTQWTGGPRFQRKWRKYTEANYVDGQKEGLSSMWKYGNGQKWFEVNYVNGKREGLKTWWHEDGSKHSEVSFVNGKEEGLFVSWYESGTKKQEANYVNGRIKGPVTTWYENGNKSAVKNMDGGLADGLQTRWYENGEKQSEGMIKKSTGLRDGPWTEYYQTGQKKSEENHLQRARPELGYLKEWGRVYWTQWYESGGKKAEGLYIRYRPPYMKNSRGQRFANYRQGHWTDWDIEDNATESCYDRGRKLSDLSRCPRPQSVSDKLNNIVAFILGTARLADDASGFSGNPGDRGVDLGMGKGNPSIVIPDADFLNAATAEADELTFSIWVKNYEIVNSSVFWVASPSGGKSKRGFQAHIPWGNNAIVFDTAGCCNANTQRIEASIASFPGYSGDVKWWNQWHHFVFTKKGSHKEIWIDGQLFLAGKNTKPLPSDFTEIWLGAKRLGMENHMHGMLDDYSVFATALGEADIRALARGDSPTTLAASTRILAYWDFNELNTTDTPYQTNRVVVKDNSRNTHKRPDTSSTYNLYGNPKNPGYPSLDPESGVLTLTPVDAYGASAVALMKEPTTTPFVLTFEFNIWDDDGGTSWGKRYNSANGISVIFAKDDSAYTTTVPPAGSAMGFIED